MTPREHQPPLSSPAELQQQMAVFATINDVLPKLATLAQMLESDVVMAACDRLQVEHYSIQRRWAGML